MHLQLVRSEETSVGAAIAGGDDVKVLEDKTAAWEACLFPPKCATFAVWSMIRSQIVQVHFEDEAVEGNGCGDAFKTTAVTGIFPLESADFGGTEYDRTAAGAARARSGDVTVLEGGTAA